MAEGKGGWALTFFKKELKVLGAAEGGRKGFVFFFTPPSRLHFVLLRACCVCACLRESLMV